MKQLICLAPLFILTACANEEPERPDEVDEARFHEIDEMLDEEAAQEERAAPEDATPPK